MIILILILLNTRCEKNINHFFCAGMAVESTKKWIPMRQQKVETKYSSIWMQNYEKQRKLSTNRKFGSSKNIQCRILPLITVAEEENLFACKWHCSTWMRVARAFLHRWLSDQRNPFYAPAVPCALSPHVRCLCRLRLSERKSMPRKLFTESLYSSSTSRKRRWKIFLRPKLIELARGASPKARNFFLFLVSYSSSARACHVWEASFESYRLNDTPFIRARQLRFYARAPFWRINFQLKLSDEDMLQPRTSHFAWYTRRVNPKESTGGWWRVKSWRRVWFTA